MQHVAYIDIDLESLQRGASCRTAACSCGWRGPQRASLELVADDAKEHENAATGAHKVRLPVHCEQLADGAPRAPLCVPLFEEDTSAITSATIIDARMFTFRVRHPAFAGALCRDCIDVLRRFVNG